MAEFMIGIGEDSGGTRRLLKYDNNVWNDFSPTIPAIGTIGTYANTGYIKCWGCRDNVSTAIVVHNATDIPNNKFYHFDGTDWNQVSPPTSWTNIEDIFGVSANAVWACRGQEIGFWNGSNWSIVHTSPSATVQLHGIWASSTSDVWVFGDGSGGVLELWHYDGSSWTDVFGTLPRSILLQGIHGISASEIYLTGTLSNKVYVFKYNGSTWTEILSGPDGKGYDIWAYDSTNVFLLRKLVSIPTFGVLLNKWNGSVFEAGQFMDANTDSFLHKIHGLSATEIHAHEVTTPSTWISNGSTLTQYVGTYSDFKFGKLSSYLIPSVTAVASSSVPQYPGDFKLKTDIRDNVPLRKADSFIEYGNVGKGVEKVQDFLQKLLKEGFFKDNN